MHEEAALELMSILVKKATLDVCDACMDWHIANYPDHVRKPRFIPRQKMIKKLTKRYLVDFDESSALKKKSKTLDLVKKKPLLLPHSGAKVDIMHHEAK